MLVRYTSYLDILGCEKSSYQGQGFIKFQSQAKLFSLLMLYIFSIKKLLHESA